jgi:hypothetical protein
MLAVVFLQIQPSLGNWVRSCKFIEVSEGPTGSGETALSGPRSSSILVSIASALVHRSCIFFAAAPLSNHVPRATCGSGAYTQEQGVRGTGIS